MRILCLTPWFPSHKQDQHGNFILDSVEALAEMGHEVIVLVSRPWRPKLAGLVSQDWVQKPLQVQDFSRKIKIITQHYISIPRSYCMKISTSSYRFSINRTMIKLIKQYQCQLIHAHTELAAIAAVDVGNKLAIPTVVTLHGISTEPKLYKGRNKKLFYEYGVSCADRVVLVGDPLVPFFSNVAKRAEHFRVVHNGFRLTPENSAHKEKNWHSNIIRFISVSNLVEGKGIDLNLRALAKLKEHGIDNWTYKIVGAGNQQTELMKLTTDLNLTNQVEFVGACQHNDVYAKLAQCDVFILPSYREAFGIAYLEAMSCGLLAVGVKGQGAQAFIENEQTGMLVPPQNVNALANTLKLICGSQDKMRRIAKAGQVHAHKHFTWDKHALNLTSVYKELVDDK